VGKKARKRRKGAYRVGASPGLLSAPADANLTSLSVIAYGPDQISEFEPGSLDEIRESVQGSDVTWVDVQGFADVESIERLGEALGLHVLSLEDVLSQWQRPKVEPYPDHLFIVLHMFTDPDLGDSEQIGMFLGDKWVVTFQERPGDCFDPVRDRLREGRPRIRSGGADYLAYALVDSIVDGYFPLVETLGEQLEAIEEVVLTDPGSETLGKLHQIKRSLLVLRRTIWPQRDVIAALTREDTQLIGERTLVYLRDCHDHAIRLMDVIENHREMASGLVDLYLSSVSNRMNEVMKVLTIIATIFIPLSFIAGLYGMNFDTSSPWNMPELHWAYGYPAALGLMAVIGGGLLYYFARKGWLS
jgi:magnesium transporter